MPNFPGSSNSIPSCDPPYPANICKNGAILIETDNCGTTFNIMGDIHIAAVVLIEKVLEESKRVISPLTGKREDHYGAVTFIFMENQLMDVEPAKKEYPKYNLKAEDRSDVLRFIDVLKSVIKMKAFW